MKYTNMTEKQMNKLGFYKQSGNIYVKQCDAREIRIRVDKFDDLRDVWNQIYNDIFAQGVEAGALGKAEQIKTALGL